MMDGILFSSGLLFWYRLKFIIRVKALFYLVIRLWSRPYLLLSELWVWKHNFLENQWLDTTWIIPNGWRSLFIISGIGTPKLWKRKKKLLIPLIISEHPFKTFDSIILDPNTEIISLKWNIDWDLSDLVTKDMSKMIRRNSIEDI